MPEWVIAVVLGVVEGLTEFLPVSSTGHLILAAELLEFIGERAETFEIFIQLGAVLAVAVLYRRRFAGLGWPGPRDLAFLRGRQEARLTWAHVGLACAPAFALGFALHSFIRRNLFSSRTVLIGLVLGGVLMIAAEAWARRGRARTTVTSLDELSLPQAVAIGCIQCLALWPGFSRSGSTISGGLVAGLDRRTAAEFSFVVAVPVMLVATVYDLVQSVRLLDARYLTTVAVGFAVSYVVARLAVVTFLRFVQKVSLIPFALYRFTLAGLWALLVLR
jgi:undecaprenyl-diphosphatase